MRAVPDGFEADAWAGISNRKLAKMYHAAKNTVEEWRFRLDIPPNPIGGTRKPVSQFNAAGEFVATYPSLATAAKKVFGCPSGIGNAAKTGRIAYGYFWKFGWADNGSIY